MIDTKELRRLAQQIESGEAGINELVAFVESSEPKAIVELLDRLEAAESECLEQARLNGMGASREAALMAKLEAAEKDRSNFLLEMGKLCAQCDTLRAKIEQMEIGKREISETHNAVTRRLSVLADENTTLRAKIERMEKQEPAYWGPKHAIEGGSTTVIVGKFPVNPTDAPLYALPGAQPAPSAPSEEAAAEMGANGGHVVEAERLAFEAWMRGHCWKLGAKWTGTEYRSAFEKGGMVDMHAMRTRELWAAWRDRAALAVAPEAKP